MHRVGVWLFVPLWRGGHIGQGAREVAAFLVLRSVEAVNDDSQQQCQSMYQSEYWSGRSRSQRKTDEDNASTKYSGLKLGSIYWRARANAGRPPTHY
jgi:hypothetical protein